MARKRIIITSSKEIYSKLNMLTFSSDVVLKGISIQQISKILKNINTHDEVLAIEKIGEYFILKKKQPVNFSVYFRQK